MKILGSISSTIRKKKKREQEKEEKKMKKRRKRRKRARRRTRKRTEKKKWHRMVSLSTVIKLNVSALFPEWRFRERSSVAQCLCSSAGTWGQHCQGKNK